MRLLDPIARLTFIGEADRLCLMKLAEQLTLGNVVLFAGAGLSFNARSRDGGSNRMLGWRRLARKLRDELGESLHEEPDALKIADYFEAKYGRKALVDAVMDAVRDHDHIPGPVHRRLVELNFKEIITTNFDTLIERAFEEQHISPQVVASGADLVRRRRPPRVIKMNGCFRISPSQIVISGNDFLAYSSSHQLIEAFVTRCFVEGQVLFVGFSLEDPAFRAINENVLRTLGEDCPQAYSIQFGSTKPQINHWYNRKVQIIDLHSGEPGGGTPEERLYQVFSAFVKIRRDLRWPDRRDRKPVSLRQMARFTVSGRAGSPSAGDEPEVDGFATFWSDWWSSLGCEPVSREKLPGLERVLRQLHCDQVASGDRRPAWQLVVDLLNRVRMSEDRGVWQEQGTSGQLWPVRLATGRWKALEPLLDDLLQIPSGTALAASARLVRAKLATLAAQLSLELLIRVADSAAERHEAGRRLVKAARRLFGLPRARHEGELWLGRFDALAIDDMGLRSCFLNLMCLLAPLSMIRDLARTWTGPLQESDLLETGDDARRFDPTPDELRIPLLGFDGVLHQGSHLYSRAANSLWSRQVQMEELGHEGLREGVEIAFRYRYLMQAAGSERIKAWTTAQLQEERLALVLSRLFLEPRVVEPRPAESGRTRSRDELGHLLLELHRGWVYGSRRPGSLRRAWSSARWEMDHKSGTSGVPWEALLLLTLPIDGRSMVAEYRRMLREAWQREQVDLELLIQLVALRLHETGFEGFARLPGELESGEVATGRPAAANGLPHIFHFERDLAELTWWVCEQAAAEAEGEEIRRLLVDALAESVGRWIFSTGSRESRNALSRALGILWQMHPERIGEVIREQTTSHLHQPENVLGILTRLAPISADRMVEGERVFSLVRLLQRSRIDIPSDSRLWLVDWACYQSPEGVDLGDLASWIVEWLVEGVENQSFAWLALAAKVELCSGLRSRVEEELSHKTGASSSPAEPVRDFFRCVAGFLREIETTAPGRWGRAGGTHLAHLVPFVEHFDEERLEQILGSVDLRDPYYQEPAAELLAALLQRAEKGLRERYHGSWLEHLEALLQTGTTGNGALGPVAAQLSDPGRRHLQTNLLVQAIGRGPRLAGSKAVENIVRTLLEAPVGHLCDLEEGLVGLIGSDRSEVAKASLEAAVGPLWSLEGFPDRQRARLRRARIIAQTRGGFRTTSRFASQLRRLPE